MKIDQKSQAYQQVLINKLSTLVSVISEITVANSTVKTNTTADDWRRLMFAIESTKTGINRTEMAMQTPVMFATRAIRRHEKKCMSFSF